MVDFEQINAGLIKLAKGRSLTKQNCTPQKFKYVREDDLSFLKYNPFIYLLNVSVLSFFKISHTSVFIKVSDE